MHFSSAYALRSHLLAGLGLAVLSHGAQAQSLTADLVFNTSSLYYAGAVTNTGNFSNSGTTAQVSYAGPSTATFRNDGVYSADAGATDQFEGPAGAAGPQELTGSIAPSFYNLILSNGSAAPFNLTNLAGLDVAGMLTLSNGITYTTNAAAGAIRLAEQATASGTFSTTCYVDGYVGKQGTTSFTYPLGTTNPATNTGNGPGAGDAIYAPITLSSPGGTTIRYTAGGTPQPTSFATQPATLQLQVVSSREYYPISSPGAVANSTITLPYGNFGPTAVGMPYVGDPATLTIAGYDGSYWTNLSAVARNSIDFTNKTVTVTLPVDLSASYSALALASTSAANPLPVQLTSFAATPSGHDALLRWQTASELQNDHFAIERSFDGMTFRVLGQQPGQGTKTSATIYQFVDVGVGARVNANQPVYYRLRQVNTDGTGTYSPVRVVCFTGSDYLPALAVYPNPATTTTALDLTALPVGSQYQVALVDCTGRLARQLTMAGGGSSALDLQELPLGIYTVLVTGTGPDGKLLRLSQHVVKKP